MKTNIFFCNGPMSALSSCFISDYLNKKNPEDEFILCVEQGTHVKASYYEIVDLIVKQNKQFKKVIRVKVNFSVLNLRKPIRYIQSIFYYRKIAKYVMDELGKDLLNSRVTLWAPSTSRLWQFFKKTNTNLNIIEHGLGEYIYALYAQLEIKMTWKRRIGSVIEHILGYPGLSNYTKIWLCSNAVEIKPSERVVQINFSEEFLDYSSQFWFAYEKLYPIATKELQSIIDRITNHIGTIYLYFPSDEVRSDMQNEFIAKQMTYLKIDENPLFIIKNHPIDINAASWKALESYGECINIRNEYNCYLPAEFVAIILGVDNIIGSGSSALYYLKSWCPDINSYIYNDYDLCMLNISNKVIKDHLALAGLLSNASK